MRRLRHVSGAVTLVTRYGFGYPGASSTRVPFENIDRLCDRLALECLRATRGFEILDTGGAQADEWFWAQGRFKIHVVEGSDGLPVEAWKVVADLRARKADWHEDYRRIVASRRGWHRLPEERFRDGPIPLRDSWRHLRGLYRRSGTFAEVKALCALERDEDAILARVRPRMKRSRSRIGDNDWEGVHSMRHRDHGWKRHRRTQWRPGGA